MRSTCPCPGSLPPRLPAGPETVQRDRKPRSPIPSLPSPVPARRQPSPPCGRCRSSRALLLAPESPTVWKVFRSSFCRKPARSPVPPRSTTQPAPARARSVLRATSVFVARLITNHRPGNRVGLLPQPRIPPEGGLVARPMEFRLLGNGVRRPLSAQRHARLACRTAGLRGRLPAPILAVIHPGRFHVSVRKRVSRFLGYIDLVGGKLRCRRPPRAGSA